MSVGRLFQCCAMDRETMDSGHEIRIVHLSSGTLESPRTLPVHELTQPDPLELGDPPRYPAGVSSTQQPAVAPFDSHSAQRLRSLRDRISLPTLRRFPVPPGCSSSDPEDVRAAELLRMYQDFVSELYRGLHLKQMSFSNSLLDYSEVHCRVMEDLETLKIDQGTGSIIEVPLAATSKVYHLVKQDGDAAFMAPAFPGSSVDMSTREHYIVLDFMRWKLALVFSKWKAAQTFLIGIELLIRTAQERRDEGAVPGWLGGVAAASGGALGGAAHPACCLADPGLRRRPPSVTSLIPMEAALRGGAGGAAASRSASAEPM